MRNLLKLLVFLFPVLLAPDARAAVPFLTPQLFQGDDDQQKISHQALNRLTENLERIHWKLNGGRQGFHGIPWIIILTEKMTGQLSWSNRQIIPFVLDEAEFGRRRTRWREVKDTSSRWILSTVTKWRSLQTEEQQFRFVAEVLYSDLPFELEWGALRDREWFLRDAVYEEWLRSEPLVAGLEKFLARSRSESFPPAWVRAAREMLLDVRKTYDSVLSQYIGLTQRSPAATAWETVIPFKVGFVPTKTRDDDDIAWLLDKVVVPVLKGVLKSKPSPGLFYWPEYHQRLLNHKSIEIELTNQPLEELGVCHGESVNSADTCEFSLRVEKSSGEVKLKVFLSLKHLVSELGMMRADRIPKTMAALARVIEGPVRSFLHASFQSLQLSKDPSTLFGNRVEELRSAKAVVDAAYRNHSLWPRKTPLQTQEAQFVSNRLAALEMGYSGCPGELAAHIPPALTPPFIQRIDFPRF